MGCEKAAPFPEVKDQAIESKNSAVSFTIRIHNVVRDTVAAKPGLRGLAHLIDAQTTVQWNLARLNDGNGRGKNRMADRRNVLQEGAKVG
jgi:hypothetical protein